MGETYIKVRSVWKYVYRATDKKRHAADFLLTKKCGETTADQFFDKAMRDNNVAEKVTMDKSASEAKTQ